MRIVPPAGSPVADLTAQAKIRQAAIEHFARDGFHKAGLRAIAATAGVSAGLVIHHFGSKDGLRAACDEQVLRELVLRARNKSSPGGLQDVIRDYTANPDESQTQMHYLARAVTEDSPAGRQFVDTLVDETEAIVRAGIAAGTMRASSDPRAVAVLITMTSLAMLTMPGHLARSLGFDRLGPDLLKRMAVPSLEFYTYGLYADDSFLAIARDSLAAPAPDAPH